METEEAQKTVTKADAPAWAKAVIVAEFHVNVSDLHTDYHGHRTPRTVALAWSKHERDLFSEMRKAAATFPETAHLGPGLNHWRVRLTWDHDHTNEAAREGAALQSDANYWRGDFVPFGFYADRYKPAENYNEGRDPERYLRDGFHFKTEEAAAAFMERNPAPQGMEWRKECEEIEHREKYSMGAGFYLKDGYSDSHGWAVKKRALSWFDPADHNTERGPALDGKPTNATAPREVSGIEVTENEKRNGVEIRFPEKPTDETRDRLKGAGFRWHRKGKFWYARRSALTLEVAYTIKGDPKAQERADAHAIQEAEKGAEAAQGIR